MHNFLLFLAACAFALGLTTGGFFIKEGLIHFGSANDRRVEVKGLSERPVIADIAIWDITYQSKNTDLVLARTALQNAEAAVRDFLKAQGLEGDSVRVLRVSAYQTQEESAKMDGQVIYANTYQLTQTIRVETKDVHSVEKAARTVATLLEAGVLIDGTQPRYIFTNLNDIKPDMIGEATRQAREAAGRFALDSGAKVGSILRAEQGWFTILPRGGGEQGEEDSIEKTVRVVTTVDFQLVD